MYKAFVRYGKESISFNVRSIKVSGNYMLPDFLKQVRIANQHTLITVHQLTDTPTEECEKMEQGQIPISKDYLKAFAKAYELPKKLSKIGIDEEKEATIALGDKLYQMRTKAQMTQGDVAYSIEVARTTYAGYETGKNEPDIRTLIKLADLYHVSLDYLVGRYQEEDQRIR